jgi:thiol-disulfide isomerase/thioredoxin/uncharacterized membrane protein YphA (DoxX/SURF4 family)
VSAPLYILLFARLPLAIVFAASGLLKYADKPTFLKALVDFGTPRPIAERLVWLLPALEIGIAVLLLAGDPFYAGAVGALTLLVAFTLAIMANLILGRRPNCRCFGQVSAKPIGWTTVARNLLLLILAAACFLEPLIQRFTDIKRNLALFPEILAASGIITVVAILSVEGWLIGLLLQQQGKLIARLEHLEAKLKEEGTHLLFGAPDSPTHGLAMGLKAPDFQLATLTGGVTALEDLRKSGLPVLLVFANPECNACEALLPNIAFWQTQHRTAFTLVVISEGSVDRNRAKLEPYGFRHLLLQQRREVATKFLIELTPSALIVAANGDIGSRVHSGSQSIEALVKQVGAGKNRFSLENPGSKRALQLGEPVPVSGLLDLDGKVVDLVQTQTQTLILFWNPRCSFCVKMLPELKAWEKSSLREPEFVLIASGTEQENRDLGLRSSIVLDRAATIMQSLQIPGTPSAFLVAAGGKIMSQVMVGSTAIWTLAGVGELQNTKTPAAV